MEEEEEMDRLRTVTTGVGTSSTTHGEATTPLNSAASITRCSGATRYPGEGSKIMILMVGRVGWV